MKINPIEAKNKLESFKTEFEKAFKSKISGYHDIATGSSEVKLKYSTLGYVTKSIFQGVLGYGLKQIPKFGPFVVELATIPVWGYENYHKNKIIEKAKALNDEFSESRNFYLELTIQEVANEIIRIFEYQIVMLKTITEVQKLARIATTKILEYGETHNLPFNRNTLLGALVMESESGMIQQVWELGTSRKEIAKTIEEAAKAVPESLKKMGASVKAVLPNNFEQLNTIDDQTWNAKSIFYKAGLRKENAKDKYDYFIKNNRQNPEKYGYRAEILYYSYTKKVYRNSKFDEGFSIKTDANKDYEPFMRIVLDEDIKDYYSKLKLRQKSQSQEKESFQLFLHKKYSVSHTALVPVFINMENRFGFDDLDLCKTDFSESNMIRISFVDFNMQNSRFTRTNMLFANIQNSDFRKSSLVEADLRGSTLNNVKFIGPETDLTRAKFQKAILDGDTDFTDNHEYERIKQDAIVIKTKYGSTIPNQLMTLTNNQEENSQKMNALADVVGELKQKQEAQEGNNENFEKFENLVLSSISMLQQYALLSQRKEEELFKQNQIIQAQLRERTQEMELLQQENAKLWVQNNNQREHLAERIAAASEEILKLKIQQVSLINYQRNVVSNFVGRDEILKQLHCWFEQNNGGVQLIKGETNLGGIGKTQTALKYMDLYKQEYNSKIVWMSAVNREMLDNNFREFAQKFAELFDYNIDEKNNKEVVNWVKHTLLPKFAKVLLVFDNVEDNTYINEYLPSITENSQYHILITTRDTNDWSRETKTLMPFDEQEVLDYARKFIPKIDPNDAHKLKELYKGFPLGLSQCLTYIKNNLDNDIQKFFENFENNPLSPVDLILDDLSHVIPKAVEVMKISSYLNADNIPIDIFDTMFDLDEKVRVFAILKGYSLISIRLEKDEEVIYIHRNTQEVIRKNIESSFSSFVPAITLVLEQMNKRNESDILRKNLPMLQHAFSLLTHYKNMQQPTDATTGNLISRLFLSCGELYSYIGDFSSAEKQYNKALQIRKKQEIMNDLEIAEILNKMAYIDRCKGHYKEAITKHKKALSIYESKNEDYSIAETHVYLGHVLQANDIQKFDKALTHYDKAKEIFQNLNCNSKVAKVLRHIGKLYVRGGAFDKAIEAYKTATATLIVNEEKESIVESANLFCDIGSLNGELGKYEEALNNHSIALNKFKLVYPEGHFEVVLILQHIGQCYQMLNKNEEALEAYNAAVGIEIKTYGGKHPRICPILMSIGFIYKDKAAYNDALEYYTKALLVASNNGKVLLADICIKQINIINKTMVRL